MRKVMQMTGKKYIVTGASSGIGRETCRYLAKLGATVILIARNEVQLKECMKELEGEGHKYYCFDLSDIESIESLFMRIVEENGKLDGLVYSAGVGWSRPLKNTTSGFIQQIFKINLFAFIELLRLFSLKKYNVGSGSVVGVSAIIGKFGKEAVTAYCASKSGMDSIVKAAAKELIKKNIRVNSVQPGWVKTHILDEYLKEVNGESDEAMQNISNALEPLEVAHVIAYLLSDAASGINGAAIPITGNDKRYK